MTSGCELLGFSKLCRVKPEMRPFKGKCRCCRKWCSWVSVCLFLSTLIPCEAGCSNFSALLQLMNWKWILKCMPAEWKSKFFGHSRTVTFPYLIFCKFSPCSIYISFFFIYRWRQTLSTQQNERLFLYHKLGSRRSFSYTGGWKIFKVSSVFKWMW